MCNAKSLYYLFFTICYYNNTFEMIIIFENLQIHSISCNTHTKSLKIFCEKPVSFNIHIKFTKKFFLITMELKVSPISNSLCELLFGITLFVNKPPNCRQAPEQLCDCEFFTCFKSLQCCATLEHFLKLFLF